METDSTKECKIPEQNKSKSNVVVTKESKKGRISNDRYTTVLTCIDNSELSSMVIPYAKKLAEALQVNLRLVTVLEPDHQNHAPFDPVEWSLRRQEAKNNLNRLVHEYRLDPSCTTVDVLEGDSAAAIAGCLSQSQQEITVFCRKDDRELGHIGATSRTVLERCSGSILLVPAGATSSPDTMFKRITVLLDGSQRAESILPVIGRLAAACDATVTLLHATPNTEVTEMIPGDSQSLQLKENLVRHNQNVATQILKRTSQRLREYGLRAEQKVLVGGDVRRLIIESIDNESADLVVLSSHGTSGHSDVPFGDVANYVMSRSPVPALMLRDMTFSGDAKVLGTCSKLGGRAPEGAD